VLSYIDVS
jgi:hypothetical protein